MTTQTMNNFETLDLETLANAEGGGCSWGGFAKQGVAGGAIVGGVGYGATCWW